MSRVLPKILGTIDHKPFAPEEIDPVWYALGIYFLPRALLEILILLKTITFFHALFEHFPGLLTEWGVLFVVRLQIPLP